MSCSVYYSHIKVVYTKDGKEYTIYVPAIVCSAIQNDNYITNRETINWILVRLGVHDFKVIDFDEDTAYDSEGKKIEDLVFTVTEHFNGYSLTHLNSGCNKWLSDGVDCLTYQDQDEDETITLSPGTIGFTMVWTDQMNNDELGTYEAYFPHLL